jgi:hypothetical protein
MPNKKGGKGYKKMKKGGEEDPGMSMIERQPDRAAQIIADRLGALSAAMAATLAGIAGLAQGE